MFSRESKSRKSPRRRYTTIAILVLMRLVPVYASDCNATSTGRVPITDLGQGFYLGQFQGGLYPNGSNDPPAAHAALGLQRAESMSPLDTFGNVDPNGRIVMISIGMSNASQEFCAQAGTDPCAPWTFMGQAAVHPDVDRDTVAIVNGAIGGKPPSAWLDVNNALTWGVVEDRLQDQGFSERQVQVAWLKQANGGPSVSLPDPNADAHLLAESIAQIVRNAKLRYPNLKMVFLSSRIYAGYSTTATNPEPFAYESAFTMKWLIETQIRQMATGMVDERLGNLDASSVAPWMAWGPYLWADGLNPRDDGLIWECDDFQPDGTHPDTSAEQKVGAALLEFMLESPFTQSWFSTLGAPAFLPGDLDQDGQVSTLDLLILLGAWGPCNDCGACPADLDGDCFVGPVDLLMLLGSWG